MSRTLSTAAKESIFAPETDLAWIVLLTISHASLTDDIRVARNTEDVISNGETYIGFPFEISLPQEREDSPPRVTLEIGNVDRQIVQAVRSLDSPADVTLEIVTSNDFDAVEAGPFVFTLREVQYDNLTVQGELSFEPILDEPYPVTNFTPGKFPSLF